MSNVVRPDKFKIGFGYIPDGYYVLSRCSENKKTLLPVLIVEGFDTNQTITITSAPNTSSSLTSIFPEISDNSFLDGDIASIDNGFLRIILTRNSTSNTLLVTERCNNLCQFCSQPPVDINDDILLPLAAHAIIDFNSTDLIGITGGEPFLYKSKMLSFLKGLDAFSNKSKLHILTNGRIFSSQTYSKQFEEAISLREVTLGIPLYSTEAEIHDLLVGSKNAWSETVTGLINLMHLGVNIELRFIPTKLNLDQLELLIPFISKTLPLIPQISIMNMEPKGYARKNWSKLYISPKEYKDALTRICKQSKQYDVNVVLFNYPLCQINPTEYSYAVKSISDWKNTFVNECDKCSMKAECCGFFSWAKGKFLDVPERIL